MESDNNLPKHPSTSHSEARAVHTAAKSHNGKLPDAFALFGPSWNAFKLNWVTFIIAVVVPILVLMIPVALLIFGFYTRSSSYLSTHSSTPAIFNIISIIIGLVGIMLVVVFYTVLLYVIKLQSAKGIKTDLKNTIKLARPVLWTTMGTYLLRNLIIFIGCLLLIFPGLYLWRRLMFAQYYAVDQKLSVMESLRRSYAESKPFSGEIWGMIAVYVVIQFAGFIPLIGYFIGIGLAIAYCCAQSIRYLQIKEATR